MPRILRSLRNLRLTAPCAVLAVLAAACDTASFRGGDDPAGGPPAPPERQPSPWSLVAGVESFASCAAVEAHIEAALAAELDRHYARLAGYIRERKRGGTTTQADSSAESGQGAPNASPMAPGSAAPGDYTKTNDQVAGVEEADFVKTNGLFLFQLAGRKLHVMKSWPAAELTEVATLDFAGYPAALLLAESGKQLIVLTRPDMQTNPDGTTSLSDALPGGGFLPSGVADRLRIDVVDVTDAAHPVVRSTYEVAGHLQGARRVGQSVRLVLSAPLPYPKGVELWPQVPDTLKWTTADEEEWLVRALADAKAKLAAQTIEQWLDVGGFARLAGAVREPLLDLEGCRGIHAPSTPARLGLTRVAMLDVDAGTLTQTVLLAQTSQLYASKDALYLATPYYWWDEATRDTDFTYIHRFDAREGGPAVYAGSGGVEGYLLNQFSMDEHEGYLRVATTITRQTEARSFTTTNRVSVLGLKDGALGVVGQTPDLAEGERIYSARFLGAKGYVVTFRQVDPLYTLDLTDPAAPKVVGELKIPGFSSYIHPLADGYLLTIGRDADVDTGRARGIKLSIFDVRDPAAPREAHTRLLRGDFFTEAQWDHKALTYFPSRGLLAIPAMGLRPLGSSSVAEYQSSVLVFRVDTEAGITDVGALDMSDVGGVAAPWGVRVSRAMMADDFVYAVSDLGVRTAAVADLSHPLATVKFAH